MEKNSNNSTKVIKDEIALHEKKLDVLSEKILAKKENHYQC
jgi:hypothetical protein